MNYTITTYNLTIAEFLSAMLAYNIKPTEPNISDGKLHRCHNDGDRTSGRHEPMTAAMRQQIDEARRLRENEQAKAHRQAAEKTRQIWAKTKPIKHQNQHKYLIAKAIQPHSARNYKGALAVPLVDESGEIVNLQFINSDGSKRFLSGGRKRTCFFTLGESTEIILIVEGFATCASLFEVTGKMVVVAFDAGNLKFVAVVIRSKYPQSEIIIAGDNDESGVGQKAAEAAALTCEGKFLFPPTTGMDWNDFINGGGKIHG